MKIQKSLLVLFKSLPNLDIKINVSGEIHLRISIKTHLNRTHNMQWCTFVVVTFIHVGPGSPIGLQSLYLFSGCSTERKISHCNWIHPILPALNYPYTYIFHHTLHSNSLMLKISSLSGLMINRKANFFLIKANFICYLKFQ